MKPFYKITEVARLYDLCADTLRYYEEQGLLHPERSESGYRLYSFDDICTLNVIRALRTLDIPMEQIRDYYKHHTVRSTLELLDREEQLIKDRIAQLTKDRAAVKTRRERLTRAAEAPLMTVIYKELPDRPCLMLEEEVIWEEEIDFVLKKLARRREGLIKALGTQSMGSVLNEDMRRQGIYTHFSGVFFLDAGKKDADHVLPAGRYASICYRGAYQQIAGVCSRLEEQLRADGCAMDGPVMELYHIDAHDTGITEEYLTEVQVKVLM